jgi:hypothetical protein
MYINPGSARAKELGQEWARVATAAGEVAGRMNGAIEISQEQSWGLKVEAPGELQKGMVEL